VANGDDLLADLAKALIGTSVNLALPGLGSLAVLAVNRGKGAANLNDEVSKELLGAFRTIAPKRRLSAKAWAKNRLGFGRKGEVREMLDSNIGLDSLLEVGKRTVEGSGRVDLASLPATERESWAALAKAQMTMAGAPGFVPGTWQDEFTALLAGLADKYLRGDEPSREHWRDLIGVEEGERDPKGAKLNDWARTVTRVFSARMAANPHLELFVKELSQSDRAAMQYALLWRLDQQRQSLQLVAAALCALLAALGIEIGVVQ
jgi:hypothetical protein